MVAAAAQGRVASESSASGEATRLRLPPGEEVRDPLGSVGAHAEEVQRVVEGVEDAHGEAVHIEVGRIG